MKTKLSVIIPTYNEEKDIGECIESLRNQSYKNIEIIIVDDGSIDRTKEIVKSFKKVKLIKGEHKGPGFSRNLGANKAKGKILIFVDADMTFDKDYLKNLTKPILEGKSFGTEEQYQKASNLNSVWSRCWGAYTAENRFKGNKGIVFRAILKKKFEEMGGFDSKYGYADDLTFLIKHGIKSDVAKGAFCYHKNPASLNEIFKQSKWIGASLSVHYPILDKKLLTIPILSCAVIGFIPLSFLVFLKKLTKGKFKPSSPKDIGILFAFSCIRVAGTIKGLSARLIKDENFR
ncbi:glycosyltransferase family 2 protein [Candidatus Pacearchaeota archaeon]|nr:glycosyltransferase family 2 protein [Candidatus Pacearchaeota archaeon]OIO42271.1 MAG: hypothetical protein AUJ63_03265 [Candidatus Pacearchaeota archaeon CG1_02_35_32]PIY81304.1 MAG: hypothetical protein COY79_03415 [Candidatus Pacearchaeota archaeon CG_4_10_14_0_8_um_filter_35_169]PJB94462.1 MAG: hypothetical protein CO081_01200 [Candidatus Pacearchaeota archaeon CG_4_9_14_0_8_um_filter_35_24]